MGRHFVVTEELDTAQLAAQADSFARRDPSTDARRAIGQRDCRLWGLDHAPAVLIPGTEPADRAHVIRRYGIRLFRYDGRAASVPAGDSTLRRWQTVAAGYALGYNRTVLEWMPVPASRRMPPDHCMQPTEPPAL